MLDNLYTDIGGKIKNLAKWTFIVDAVLAVFAGAIAAIVALFTAIYAEEFEPLLAIFLVPFAVALEIAVAWVATWTLYAFGELVERVCRIEEKLNGDDAPSNGNKAATPSKSSSYSDRLKQIADEKTAVPNKVTAPKNDEWYCPDCDLYHKSYVGTCGCGRTRAYGNTPHPKVATPSRSAVSPNAEEWYCPDCDLYHKSYVGTCGCGRTRPSEAAPKPVPTLKADEWYCPNCGLIHKTYVGSCGCGCQKP